MGSITEDYVNKITQTTRGIDFLVNQNSSYQKQMDYNQVLMTTSSTFADIASNFTEIIKGEKGEKGIDEGIQKFSAYLESKGASKEDAILASNCLYGKKQSNKTISEKVFVPYLKESFNYIISETGMNGENVINDSIKMNDEEFELSSELKSAIKSIYKDNTFIKEKGVVHKDIETHSPKKQGLFSRLFHRKDNKVQTTNDEVDKTMDKKVDQQGNKTIDSSKRVQIIVKDAMDSPIAKSNSSQLNSRNLTNAKNKNDISYDRGMK